MRLVGMNPVVVHGGGPQISDLMRRLGQGARVPRRAAGHRRGDGRHRADGARRQGEPRHRRVAEPARLVRGRALRRGRGAHPGRGRATSGSASWATIRHIDPSILERLIREELIPVIATIGMGAEGQAYNVNADTVAGAIAEALDAEKLVYLTDVAGVYGDYPDESSLISRIDAGGLEALVRRREGGQGDDPEARVVRAGAAQRRDPRRTSSTAASRTRCCSSSSPAKASARWWTHERGEDPARRSSRQLDAEHVMQTYGRLPVAFVRGEGTRLWDSEGNEYLDFLGGLAVTSLGHAHPEVAAAIADQATHAAARLEPVLQRGAAAAGRAARPAAHVGDRHAGRGVLRQLGRRGQRVRDQARPPLRPAARRPRALPRAVGLQLVPRPHAHDARGDRPAPEAGDVPAAARAASARSSSRTSTRSPPRWTSGSCAVLLEAVQGEGGVQPAPPGYLEAVRALCDEREALLDHRRGADRARPHRALVRVRARRRRASRHRHDGQGARQRRPDRRVLGPRPMSPTAFRPGDHATTFGGQPLAARAALAVLDVMEREDVPRRSMQAGERLTKALARASRRPRRARRRPAARGRAEPAAAPRRAAAVALELLERGLVVNAVTPDRAAARARRCSSTTPRSMPPSRSSRRCSRHDPSTSSRSTTSARPSSPACSSRPRPGKADPATIAPVLAGRGVALVFEKPSARTRVSSDMAVRRARRPPGVPPARRGRHRHPRDRGGRRPDARRRTAA